MEIILLLSILGLAVPVSIAVGRLPARVQPWLQPLPALAGFILLAGFAMPVVLQEGAIGFKAAWIPQLEIDLAFRLSGMGLLLALLVTGIGTLILLYATGYMGKDRNAPRLYALLYLFMLSMAGLAVADHMILFFLFWELTSISSYMLIGYNHADPAARRNALQALLVTGTGGLALLGGFILMAGVAGTWSLHELQGASELVKAHPHYPAILCLVLLGAFTKSAQFPFHFWLPNAMSAPTPVSAYLHSATMVKAGVFLLFLVLPVLGGTTAWMLALVIAGSLTLLGGGVFGLCQYDLKKVLAGTTVAVLGLLTLLLGIGSEKDVLAALVFLLGHALYKATLFMVAGAVDHETGTRDTRLLGGLRKAMPWTAFAALLAALSKMGLPPFFGFIGKEYTYKAGLATEWQWILLAVLITGNAMILALAVKTAILPFWRKAPAEMPAGVHEAPWSMRIGPLLLAAMGIFLGTFPHLLDPLLSSAKTAAMGYPVETGIYLWQGLNLPVLLSAFTVLIGFFIIPRKDLLAQGFREFPFPRMESVYNGLLDTTLRFAAWQTRFLQSGYLRNYLLIILGSTTLLILNKLWRFGGIPVSGFMETVTVGVVLVGLLMLAAIVLAVTTESRLTALLALGTVGFGVAWIFATYSAPDLAITQILVETLTVVLFAWVVYKLPAFRILSNRRTFLFDALISGVAGILVTLLVLKSQLVSIGPEISDTLVRWSLPEAKGANVVNVILVDFRALDTWGEICVLAIAALGVWALLNKANRGKGEDEA